MKRLLLVSCGVFLASPAFSDPATVLAADVRPDGSGWRFEVTLKHGDGGWDDYADGWRVIGPDGEVLGTRVLTHPHVNEQPFTRGLAGVRIPEGVTAVEIEARTSMTGWGGARLVVELP